MLEELKSNQLEFIRYTAIILMVFDHIMDIYFHGNDLLRIPGRIVLPLFAFLLVYNYMHNTHNKKAYLGRLFAFALISQPFYSYAFAGSWFNFYTLNIFFTLFISLLLIYLKEEILFKYSFRIRTYFLFVLLFITYFITLFLSYKFWGVLMIYSMYMVLTWRYNYIYAAKSSNLFAVFEQPIAEAFYTLSLIMLAAAIYFLNYSLSPVYTLAGEISLLIIYAAGKIDIRIPRLNKWFFYIFYPVHLVIIKGIK